MAEDNQVQEPEQEQAQVQETEPAQEPVQEAEKEQQEDKPAEEKSGGELLMPILYALLAAVGAFTLIMIIGIAVTIITRPAQPSETPPAQQSSQVTPAAARTRCLPDGEGLDPDASPGDIAAFFFVEQPKFYV